MADIYTINNLAEPIDFETREFEARTLQNAKNLLMCRRGEVPYDRLRGLSGELEHMAYSELQACVHEQVALALNWEPDVQLIAVRTRVIDEGELYIEADIVIGGN